MKLKRRSFPAVSLLLPERRSQNDEKKEYASRYGFLNEKTMSSGFKALIPDPLGRYKYQTIN